MVSLHSIFPINILLYFNFLPAKIVRVLRIAQGSPTGWLASKKSSSLRSGIFSCQALHNPGHEQPGK